MKAIETRIERLEQRYGVKDDDGRLARVLEGIDRLRDIAIERGWMEPGSEERYVITGSPTPEQLADPLWRLRNKFGLPQP